MKECQSHAGNNNIQSYSNIIGFVAELYPATLHSVETHDFQFLLLHHATPLFSMICNHQMCRFLSPSLSVE